MAYLYRHDYSTETKPMTAIDTEGREITLSEGAIKRLTAILAQEEGGAERMLRVSINGGGCSGFQYSFDLDDTRNGDDLVFETAGLGVVTDPISFELLGGAEIDYVQELIGASFQVRNPNATAGCSCGASFAVG